VKVMDRIAQAADLIWRRIGDDIVVITADAQSTHVLNKTAAFIWEACDGSSGTAEIVARLCERFEVSYEEASADVGQFVEDMLRIGLLNRAGETALD
jgi:hypothetical protein